MRGLCAREGWRTCWPQTNPEQSATVPQMDESAAQSSLQAHSRALDRLRGTNAGRWPNIAAAEATSRGKMELLAKLVADLLPTDEGALVVFGSLARGEFTAGSDLDWTVLIDGRADSGHLDIVHELKPRLVKAGFKVPGPTEIFGGLVFSHELIHAIGGDEDTNKNMTRRLLMLLESAPVQTTASESVHNRVVQGILYRYVEEDASFLAPNDPTKKIPRFLLNDVVRFWRTMAVDYANKYRARAGEKWALRNIKLRMSRKLLFVSGLFMCISWKLSPHKAIDPNLVTQELVDHLQRWTRRPPLESLAVIIEQYAPTLADNIFNSYDSFLELLGDKERREVLERLPPEDSYKNEVFIAARKISDNFDGALTDILFESDIDISKLSKRYGVF